MKTQMVKKGLARMQADGIGDIDDKYANIFFNVENSFIRVRNMVFEYVESGFASHRMYTITFSTLSDFYNNLNRLYQTLLDAQK